MDPVYAVVKGRSTTYCALKIGQAQDVDISAEWRGLFSTALFYGCVCRNLWLCCYRACSSLAIRSAFSARFNAMSNLPDFSASSDCVMVQFALLYSALRAVVSRR